MATKNVQQASPGTYLLVRPPVPPTSPFSPRRWRVWFAHVGPGALMALAYLDPGNIEADLQTGVHTGMRLLWLLALVTWAGFTLQVLCSRIGAVTQRGLAEHCRDIYPRPVAVGLWLCMESAIVGSDMQEVIGTAIALDLLLGVPLYVGVILTSFDSMLFLLMYKTKKEKWLTGLFAVLIAVLVGSFIVTFFAGEPAYDRILHGFVPGILKRDGRWAVGMLGAVIMPHNLFLHTGLVVDRLDRENTSRAARVAQGVDLDTNLRLFAADAGISLAVSFFVNAAIVALFARHFHVPGEGAETAYANIGLVRAGEVLRDMLGPAATVFWGIGLMASGQASTMTGTIAGQMVFTGFWDIETGRNAIVWRVALVRALALGPALALAFLHPDTIDVLDEWLNILQSIILPMALLPVIRIAASWKIMGAYANSRRTTAAFAGLAACVVVINLYIGVVSTVSLLPQTLGVALGMLVLGAVYVGCIAYVGWVALHNA